MSLMSTILVQILREFEGRALLPDPPWGIELERNSAINVSGIRFGLRQENLEEVNKK